MIYFLLQPADVPNDGCTIPRPRDSNSPSRAGGQAGDGVRVPVQGVLQVQLLQLLVVEPDADHAAGSRSQDQPRVGADTSQNLPHQVVGLADKYSLVCVVRSQPETLVSKTPGEVSVTVSRHQNLVLLDCVDQPLAVLDLPYRPLHLLHRGHARPQVGQVVEENFGGGCC